MLFQFKTVLFYSELVFKQQQLIVTNVFNIFISLCQEIPVWRPQKIFGSELQLNKNKKANDLVTHSFVVYKFVATSKP